MKKVSVIESRIEKNRGIFTLQSVNVGSRRSPSVNSPCPSEITESLYYRFKR